jgi:hypothetical protein
MVGLVVKRAHSAGPIGWCVVVVGGGGGGVAGGDGHCYFHGIVVVPQKIHLWFSGALLLYNVNRWLGRSR